MEKAKLTFEDVCRYAELSNCLHREDLSKAKDLTQTYYWNPWRNCYIMVLYEAPKRLLRGGVNPEVCWWCIDGEGELTNEASRNIRRMTPAKGLGITVDGYDKIMKVLNMEDHNNGKNN